MNRSLSLRAKLISVIVGVSLVAEGLAAAGFSWLAVRRFWQFTESQVEAIGNIVADQAAPAIALRDRKAARELSRPCTRTRGSGRPRSIPRTARVSPRSAVPGPSGALRSRRTGRAGVEQSGVSPGHSDR